GNPRSVDNSVLRIRQKIGPFKSKIKSIRKAGYSWQ
ncbi:MAG: DNA-binding response regulator, partial [Candidatus Dadabacteria bacterium]